MSPVWELPDWRGKVRWTERQWRSPEWFRDFQYDGYGLLKVGPWRYFPKGNA